MARKRSDHRKADRLTLWGAIVGDPLRKVAAIGLAILLWHYLDARVTKPGRRALDVEFVHEGNPELTQRPKTLQVRIDRQTYSPIEMIDPVTQRDVMPSGIELELRGPKRLIESLDENPGFTVSPNPTNSAAEIDVRDIRAINPNYQNLIHAMIPPKVVLRLARNERLSLTVGRSAIKPPLELDSELQDRLLWDQAEYSALSATVFGPEAAIATISNQNYKFEFVPNPTSAERTSIDGSLRLIKEGANLEMNPPNLTATVPLRPRSLEFEFEEVPVILQGTPRLLERYKPRSDRARVTIRAYRSLEGKLSTMSKVERQEWSLDNTLLVAPLSEDAQVVSPVFVILDPNYIEERDYKVVDRPPVSILRKP